MSARLLAAPLIKGEASALFASGGLVFGMLPIGSISCLRLPFTMAGKKPPPGSPQSQMSAARQALDSLNRGSTIPPLVRGSANR
jgi:hypothetical protein